MSLLEKFSYRRREVMVVNGSAKVDNTQSVDHEAINGRTPNKAHPSEVTSVPETPDSLLPTPPSHNIGQKIQQKRQRRRARISSSSEEEEVQTAGGPNKSHPPGKGSLFAELPVSKRRKKESNGFPAEASKPEECELGLQLKRKQASALHGNPKKRLFHSSRDSEDNGLLSSPSPSSCCSHGDSKSQLLTAASRGKLKKGKRDSYVSGGGGG